MNDEFAMYRACLLDAKDNTPRMVYADWLEENGTTDRQAATAEWIRLTCKDNKHIGPSRRPGEGDWIRKNADRLWPEIFNTIVDTSSFAPFGTIPRSWIKTEIRLMSQRIVFRIPLMGKTVGRVVNTLVSMYTCRGICGPIWVTALRAAKVLKILAADNPLSSFHLSGSMVDEWSNRQTACIYYQGLKKCGLEEVWEGLEGHCDTRTMPIGRTFKVYDKSMHKNPQEVARNALSASLTRYARKLAGVPHYPIPLIQAEEAPSELVMAPPRIGELEDLY